MSKKSLKTLGIAFDAITFAILFFPWLNTYYKGNIASSDITIMGFNLAEFSAWGMIIVILPVLILAVFYSNLENKTKTLLFLMLYLLGCVSFYNAVSQVTKWLTVISGDITIHKIFLFLYLVCMSLSLFSFYLICNKKNTATPKRVMRKNRITFLFPYLRYSCKF